MNEQSETCPMCKEGKASGGNRCVFNWDCGHAIRKGRDPIPLSRLETALYKIDHVYIAKHKNREELLKRLLEETEL